MKHRFSNKLLVLTAVLFFAGCQKLDMFPHHGGGDDHQSSKPAKAYSSDVATKWMELQCRLMVNVPGGAGGLKPSRWMSYGGITLYETVLPGMEGYRTLAGQLSGMPVMPAVVQGLRYNWPAAANAALATLNRSFFPTNPATDLAGLDSLENALAAELQPGLNAAEYQRSVDFGKAVARAVFDWSTMDGSATVYPPYVLPAGPGFWVPTPPAFGPPLGPHWGENRVFVSGSLDGTAPPPPPAYSKDPSSDFYKMQKEVYDISFTLTPDETALALYFRDGPGYGGGHYLETLKQILMHENSKLDFAALAYAKTGIAIFDALIGCWQTKYKYNVERPITYIHDELGHPEWVSLIGAPSHPDYTSGHATASAAWGTVMTKLLGNHYHFTEHTYDWLGMAPRSYTSFEDFANQVSNARITGGIHSRNADFYGNQQGQKVAKNIESLLKFKD